MEWFHTSDGYTRGREKIQTSLGPMAVEIWGLSHAYASTSVYSPAYMAPMDVNGSLYTVYVYLERLPEGQWRPMVREVTKPGFYVVYDKRGPKGREVDAEEEVQALVHATLLPELSAWLESRYDDRLFVEKQRVALNLKTAEEHYQYSLQMLQTATERLDRAKQKANSLPSV